MLLCGERQRPPGGPGLGGLTEHRYMVWPVLLQSRLLVLPLIFKFQCKEDSCHELSPPSLGEQARERWRQDSGSLAGRWGFRCGGLRLGMKEDGVQ
ncbi:unnamed protein product [Rangifer tarandus platyrhynchus]|uniref:Uncharacterized protein n=1 Tax=Rangifer tarandus platyrhynchus TaxID=3082113 RepID=A0ABN8YC35_RANTA|nr:unnamed protein product [Rangifer tarandus platyrhynchus]